MTPWKHAESSARKWGGQPKDYIELHEWFDATKQYTGDWTHRALRHHSAGIQWAVEKFGYVIPAIVNGAVVKVPTKVIAEQHVTEDCGYIPTPQDYLRPLKQHPEDWMLRVAAKTTQPLEIV